MINNITYKGYVRTVLMIRCLKIWWRYIKPLPWNMLEPCLNLWRCEDLMFHVLFKPHVRVLYLD